MFTVYFLGETVELLDAMKRIKRKYYPLIYNKDTR